MYRAYVVAIVPRAAATSPVRPFLSPGGGGRQDGQCCRFARVLSTVLETPDSGVYQWHSSRHLYRGRCRCRSPQVRVQDSMSRILLAEDDNDMRRFLVKALQSAGHDVVAFDNGRSAYERIREEPFTLLLTDIVMPEMDGIELARRSTELDPDLKVMFITGFAAVALNPDSKAPKNAKVLSKPFHLRDLVNEIERMLAA
jgi:two-component system cell cycle response regulator CpdR